MEITFHQNALLRYKYKFFLFPLVYITLQNGISCNIIRKYYSLIVTFFSRCSFECFAFFVNNSNCVFTWYKEQNYGWKQNQNILQPLTCFFYCFAVSNREKQKTRKTFEILHATVACKNTQKTVKNKLKYFSISTHKI